MAQVHMVCGDYWIEVYVDGIPWFAGHEMGNHDVVDLLRLLGHGVTREELACECGHAHEFHSDGECRSCDCPMFEARPPRAAAGGA